MRKLKTLGDTAAVVSPPSPPSSGQIVDVSHKLVVAMESADRESRVHSARAAVFESNNAAKERPMPDAMQQVIERQFIRHEDIVTEHRELETLLDTAKKVGHQANALEEAEKNARRAFKLWITFRQMTLEWEMDNRIIFSDMRDAANKNLHEEKKSGFRSKQITDADVENEIASCFPDEWRAQEIKRSQAHKAEKSLEHLVEMWGSKCRSLGTLVGKGR